MMRKRMKHFVSVILLCAMFLQIAASDGLSAATVDRKFYTGSVELIQDGALTGVVIERAEERYGLRSTSGQNISIEDILYDGMILLEEQIDVSAYRLPPGEFAEALQKTLNGSPELFYVGKTYGYRLDRSGEYVAGFVPSYEFNGNTLEADEIGQMKRMFEETADSVLSTIDPEWSDLEKALYVHDYLASQYEYDTRSPGSETDPCHYDAYSLIVEGKAVCEGYSLAYLYFMKRLGISCSTVPSDEMRHMWNQIQIDGAWYHVDVTQDDPLNDIPGRARHTRFLLSDEAMSAMGYTAWHSLLSDGCMDSSYDDYFWKESEAPFVNCKGNWYFVKSSGEKDAGIYRWDPSETENAGVMDKKVDLVSYRWPAARTGSYYSVKYTGLAKHDGKIYFNTPDEIRYFSVSEEGETEGEILSQEINISDPLFGIRIKNNILEYAEGISTIRTVDGEQRSIISAKPVKSACTFETPDPTFAPPVVVTPEPLPSPSTVPDSGNLPGADATQNPSGESPLVSSVPINQDAPVVVTPPSSAGSAAVSQSTSVQNDTQTLNDGAEPSTDTKILSRIKISIKKNRRSLTVRAPKRSKVTLSINKKILLDKKKKCKKLTISATKNKSGKITVKLSSRLPQKTRVTVTVSVTGKKYKKVVRI